MSIWWSLQLRRDAASVPLARRLLTGAMDTAGVDPDVAHELSLALTEACANAVQHAGGRCADGRSEVYWVTASIDGDLCRIEVTDAGPGFPVGPRAPVSVPVHDRHQEDGRGLRLIEALSDDVRYGSRADGECGTVVSFDKILKWREDAVLLHT